MATSLGTSSIQPGTGYFSAGLQATRGYRKLNLDTSNLVRENGIGMPTYVNGPSPETLFRIKGVNTLLSPFTENGEMHEVPATAAIIQSHICDCPNMFGSSETTVRDFNEAFTKSKQKGYKDRTTQEDNMKTNFNFPNSCNSTELLSPQGLKGDSGSGKISAEVVNEEYVTYKYGYRDVAPNNAKDLPGPLTATLVKGSDVGPAIWTTKKFGHQRRGRYAGYQQATTNADGLIYQGKTI